MEILVYILGIMLAVFAFAVLVVAWFDLITAERERRAADKASKGYVVTEYVYNGEVIYTTRAKIED